MTDKCVSLTLKLFNRLSRWFWADDILSSWRLLRIFNFCWVSSCIQTFKAFRFESKAWNFRRFLVSQRSFGSTRSYGKFYSEMALKFSYHYLKLIATTIELFKHTEYILGKHLLAESLCVCFDYFYSQIPNTKAILEEQASIINLFVLWNWIIRWEEKNWKAVNQISREPVGFWQCKALQMFVVIRYIRWSFSYKTPWTHTHLFRINICWVYATFRYDYKFPKSIHKFWTQIKPKSYFSSNSIFTPQISFIATNKESKEVLFLFKLFSLKFMPARFHRFLFIGIFMRIQRSWQ